jgi:drug/metabolite transporter (DMT)-like permease
VAVASLLAGEQITPQFALGGLLVGAGVYVGALSRPIRGKAVVLPERRSTEGRIP